MNAMLTLIMLHGSRGCYKGLLPLAQTLADRLALGAAGAMMRSAVRPVDCLCAEPIGGGICADD
ncbi:MAG: hypothetical protein K9K30_10780 [Burkholderiaceae bacterium]|nr:hypothetical protein [Sulfuritalea sp.]MCF8175710.1 hypothetical protein [Burkholderiaceae bacterium]